VRVVRVREPEPLQRSEIVRIAELVAEPLELVPVALLALRSELLGQITPEVVGDPVVVEQRVVDVKQEDGVRRAL
jgi:hypothetical protein